jgi:Ribonuclease G/E
MPHQSKTTTQFKYSGNDEKKFIKKVIRVLYDADIDELIFKDGNRRNLTRENVIIKVGINEC